MHTVLTLLQLRILPPLLPPDDGLYHELLTSREDEGKRRPEKKGRVRQSLYRKVPCRAKCINKEHQKVMMHSMYNTGV